MFLSRSAQSLHFAIRPAVVAKHLGMLFSGFSTRDDSMAGLGEPWAVALLTIVSIAGALLRRLLERASVAKSVRLPVRVGRSRIEPEEVEGIVAVVAAYLGVVLVSWLGFVAHGHEPLDSLFGVVSAPAPWASRRV